MSAADRDERTIVELYVEAMQLGASGVDDLVALFSEDGVYREPFTNPPRDHVGRAAIRDYVLQASSYAPPGLRLSIDSLHIEPPTAVAEWTCHSTAFQRPSRGRDTYTIHAGVITLLVTELIEPPVMHGAGTDSSPQIT